ncbi:hypothetical protein CIHG_02362, partial [Coccidioides immitis H538.4]
VKAPFRPAEAQAGPASITPRVSPSGQSAGTCCALVIYRRDSPAAASLIVKWLEWPFHRCFVAVTPLQKTYIHSSPCTTIMLSCAEAQKEAAQLWATTCLCPSLVFTGQLALPKNAQLPHCRREVKTKLLTAFLFPSDGFSRSSTWVRVPIGFSA